jgi:hypothetical protein
MFANDLPLGLRCSTVQFLRRRQSNLMSLILELLAFMDASGGVLYGKVTKRRVEPSLWAGNEEAHSRID